jgi:hypothetical protein
MNFLDRAGLEIFLGQLKNIFGYKSTLDAAMATRREQLLEIDYEKELAFDTDWIVGNNAPYVGQAYVGQTYVA